MSHRPGANKRKESQAADDQDEERKEDKRPRQEPAAAAAASSSSAAAATAPSSSAAAASRLGVAAAPSPSGSSRVIETIEELLGSDLLERTDGAAASPSAAPAVASRSVAADSSPAQMSGIAQQGARCSRPGCELAVTHYCHDCAGDLCAEHERTRHAALPSHAATTVPIAQKESYLRGQSQSVVAQAASAIRARTEALLQQQQHKTQKAETELKQAEAQTQAKKRALQTNEQASSTLQQTVDQMRLADDDTVIEMSAASLLEAPTRFQIKRDSTVLNTLDDERVADLKSFLGHRQLLFQSNARLIYRASRDGFKAKDWWRMCGNKASLLTLVKVKGNGFVFGAFAPFPWPSSVSNHSWIVDLRGGTMLFSLENAHSRAVKLPLNETLNGYAGRASADSGPVFGRFDLRLMADGKSADSPDGNCTRPDSFEFDRVADGGAPIAYDKTLLAGDDGKGLPYVNFAAAEIECWQL